MEKVIIYEQANGGWLDEAMKAARARGLIRKGEHTEFPATGDWYHHVVEAVVAGQGRQLLILGGYLGLQRGWRTGIALEMVNPLRQKNPDLVVAVAVPERCQLPEEVAALFDYVIYGEDMHHAQESPHTVIAVLEAAFPQPPTSAN